MGASDSDVRKQGGKEKVETLEPDSAALVAGTWAQSFAAQGKQSCAPCKAAYCYGLEVVAGLAAGLAERLEVEAVPPTMVADVMVSSLGHLAAMYFSPPFSMAS